MKKRKNKPKTQKVTTVTPTAEKVGIYLGGKLIAVSEPVEITKHELNQN